MAHLVLVGIVKHKGNGRGIEVEGKNKETCQAGTNKAPQKCNVLLFGRACRMLGIRDSLPYLHHDATHTALLSPRFRFFLVFVEVRNSRRRVVWGRNVFLGRRSRIAWVTREIRAICDRGSDAVTPTTTGAGTRAAWLTFFRT